MSLTIQTVFIMDKEWVTGKSVCPFIIKKDENLWYAEEVGGCPACYHNKDFHEIVAQLTLYWNVARRGRLMHSQVKKLIAGENDPIEFSINSEDPFCIYLRERGFDKDFVTLSSNDILFLDYVSSTQIRCVPQSELRCYLESSNGLYQSIDAVTKQSVSGMPRSREEAIHQACAWLDQQAAAEVQVVLKMYYLAWLEGRTND
jgi:hypothetical protein